ncbi:regucalcin-like [Contarinia nasturtii]|uniref:regucalcin-like n=1 Tax=Contarinia nasturtii TaxID=265458 RepID=UPI0012D472CE|nr:regucalcin-like [Contarinia nasturtii]
MYKICITFCFLSSFVASIEIIPISSDVWNHTYSPHWDVETQSLHFVDFLSENRVLNRYDMCENRIYSATIETNQVPAFMIPLKRRPFQFAGGIDRSVKVINWDGRDSVATISKNLFRVEQSSKYDGNFWSVSKASPSSRFYGGTYRSVICSLSSTANASLYRYSKNIGVGRLVKNLKVSGGIDWNVKERKFYHVDSCNGIIREFDYDPKTMNICNERIVFKFRDIDGDRVPSYIPLGLTIDTKGCLWVALYFGGAILKIDPKKSKVMRKIELPTEIVTGVAFGGRNLDILFATTGSKAFSLSSGEISKTPFSPGSGHVYMIKGLGAKGFPGREMCI